MLERLLLFLKRLCVQPQLQLSAARGSVSPDVMFARYEDDDYEDHRPRRRSSGRRRSVAESRSRFDGGTGSRKSNDTMMIIGIVIGVIVVVGAIGVFLKPTEDIPAAGGKEALSNLRVIAADIYLWKQKHSPEKLFPPQADDFMPGANFFKHCELSFTIRGIKYYYSAKADRTGYVVSCCPEKDGIFDSCYYMIRDSLGGDARFYKSEWHKQGDMTPMENALEPLTNYSWTAIQ